MADEFLDKALQAESAELKRVLSQLRTAVNRDKADVQAAERGRDTRERKATQRVAREEAIERSKRAASRGSRTLGADIESERALRTSRDRLSVEEKISRAKQAQLDYQTRVNRLQLPPAGGTGTGRYGGLSAAEVAERQRRGLTTGGLFGGGPPPPRRPTAGGGEYGPADDPDYRRRIREQGFATRELASNQQQAAAASGRLATGQRGLSVATQEAGVAAELAANRYRRHGALTTEFLDAARRGQVDIRELGYQVTATIGKFAGWTAAATAVYGAASALSAMGEGALASLDGVNQLQRIITTGLDTEQVQREFRDLSEEFNLPIDQVAESAYQMSKIFGAQGLEATLEGTRAALFAVKVGELEAGEATRFLTSIIQGFGLEANQLPAVMDAINQATNKFGGNVGGMTQGVANASGAFRAANGDFRDLIALVETGIKVTGRSGSEIGTALRRTAEIVQRPERRATIVQLLGIDPRDASITEVLERAAERLKGASPDVRSAILRAITTPELASGRILPILQNYDMVRRVRREVESDRSAGSAERELQRALKSPREEISRFRNELQRMGSTLAQIGALDPFVLMLTGANRVLDTANSILGVFGDLPRPLRTAVALLAQGAAAVALLRRFNVGSVLPGAAGTFLQRNPQKLARADALASLRGYQTETGEELRRTSIQTLGHSRQVDFLRSINASQDEIQAAEATYNESLNRRRFLAHQQQLIARELADVQKGATAAVTAGTLRRDQPGRQPVIGAAAGVGAGAAAGGAGLVAAATAGGRGREVLDDIARQERLMQARMAGLGVAGQAVGATIDKGNAALKAARAGTAGLGAAASARVAALRQMGPAIGALDGTLIALFVGYEVVRNTLENRSREREIVGRIEKLTSTVEDPHRIAEQAKKFAEENENFLTRVQDAYADVYNSLGGAIGLDLNLSTPHQDREAAAQRARQDARGIRAARERGAAPGFFQREILARLRKDLADSKTAAEQERIIQKAEQDLGASRQQIYGDASAAARRQLRSRGLSQISEIQRNLVTAAKGLDYQLDLILDPKQLEAFILTRTNKLGRGFPAGGRINRSLAGAAVRARELAATASPEDTQRLLQIADQAEQQVIDQAKTRLDRALDYARTPGAAGRARQRFLSTARNVQVGAYRRRIQALREGIRSREEEIEGQAAALDQAQGIGTRAGSPQARRGAESRKQLSGLRSQQGEARTRIRELRRTLREQRRAFNDIRREQERAQFELELAFFDARTERLQSVTADPLAQSQILVGRLRERTSRVMDAFRRHLATQQDVDRAIAQQNQALQQQASQELQRFQLTQGVSTAQFAIGATDDQLLQRQLADAQSYLARAQSYGNRISPEEVLNAQRQVYELQRQIAEQARQNAEALLEAQERAALAGADTELEQINIRLRYFRRRQVVAPPRTPVERQQRKADLAELNVQRRNARLQERVDTQQFLLDIGRISQDQFADFLRNFLRTHQNLRKINRELYRNLKRQLYQITHDEGARESFELAVGDIRLPTVYDVRRALGGPTAARRASARSASVTNMNTLTLYVARDADMAKVAQVLDDYTSGGVKEAARAAGVIG